MPYPIWQLIPKKKKSINQIRELLYQNAITFNGITNTFEINVSHIISLLSFNYILDKPILPFQNPKHDHKAASDLSLGTRPRLYLFYPLDFKFGKFKGLLKPCP